MPLPDSSTTVLAAARAYVELGLHPIPVYGVHPGGACMCGKTDCAAAGKHPIGSGWQRQRADLDTVSDAFARHVGNIGLYLGGSRFVVLDFDGEPGRATRDALAAECLLPETLIAQSGSGGSHYLYELALWHAPEQITDRRVGPGWDVKKRGQFLVAPSVHRSGGRYEWISDAPIATLPDALYERIRKQTKPTPIATGHDVRLRRARAYVAKMPPAISGAGGHDATFAVARKLVQDFQLSDDDAWVALCEYNERCHPPWSERELRHKLDDARNARVANPIEDRPRAVGNTALAIVAAPPVHGPEQDWKQHLLWQESRTGKPKLVVHFENVVRILNLHPAWRDRIRYDEFKGRVIVTDPPWSEFHRPTTAAAVWQDEDDARLHGWMRSEFHEYAFAPAVKDCRDAVDIVARHHGFNPVRDYLASLRWDGVRRVTHSARTYFGAESTPYTERVLAWWLISAVARAHQPGCKADHVLILEGAQGLGKSTALEILAGGEWFTDSPIDLNSKDAFERVRGRWIVELAELDSLFGAKASRAKMFFSSKRDDYRAAYGHREREQPRTCVFAGTTNEDQYLSDPTGARRFWPLRCTRIDHAALRADRDQIWAEAVAMYQGGHPWYPSDEDIDFLVPEQEARREVDASWESNVARYLATRVTDVVTVPDLLIDGLGLVDMKDHTRAAQTRIGIVMRSIGGWRKVRATKDGVRVWVYERTA